MWGYTIIEVMIVLAITALMFFAAVTVFSSQRGPTDFSQSMQDLNSAIQEYANRVVTSDYPGSGSYSCSASSGRAVLSQPGGSGTTCLFLGLAIQALPGQGALQIYTVLGNKDIWSGSDTGNPSTTIDNARPEPAMLGGSYVLNETYTLGASATVVSARNYNLLGMYNGLPGDNVASDQGTNALVLVGYNCGNAGCIGPVP